MQPRENHEGRPYDAFAPLAPHPWRALDDCHYLTWPGPYRPT